MYFQSGIPPGSAPRVSRREPSTTSQPPNATIDAIAGTSSGL